MNRNSFFKYSLFALAVFILFFLWINKIPLWSSDEGRYGEIAREMFESRNFVVPQFNYIAYLEKPVLAPVLTAASYSIFGINSFSTRLPTLLAALAGIFLCYAFTKKLWNRQTAELASLLLATSIGYVLVGRFAVIDMLMTFFLSAAMFCLITGFLEGKKKYYFAAYVFMGLGFLTKGLIGLVLPAFIFFVFLVWTKNLQALKKIPLGWGILIFLAIAAPWVIAISMKKPDFFDVFIIRHHFARFVTSTFGRSRPFWFFVPVLFVISFPWSFFIPSAIVHGLKKQMPERLKIQFLISWITAVFVFFSIPRSKLPYYLLPVTMPVVILIADLFSSWMSPKNTGSVFSKWTWPILAIICCLGFTGANIFLLFTHDPKVAALKFILQIGSVVILLGGLWAWFYATRQQKIEPAILTLASTTYLILILIIAGMRSLSPIESTFYFAEFVSSRIQPGDVTALFASPDRFSDFPFHLRRRVMIVGSNRGTLTNESLKPENSDAAKKWFLSMEEFAQLSDSRSQRVFCLMKKDNLKELTDHGLKSYTVLKEEGGKVLIVNF